MIKNTLILLILTCAFVDAADTDGDGLDNAVETKTGVYVSPSNTGTDPLRSDTDGDSVSDGMEVREFTSPVDSTKFNLSSQYVKAYYPFSGDANDWSVNKNDGTVHGAILVSDRFGTPNSAYSFDGFSQYIDAGDPVGKKPIYLTQSAWVRTTVSTAAPGGWSWVVLTKRHADDGSDWPSLSIHGYNQGVTLWEDDRGGEGVMYDYIDENWVIEPRDGKWHHIVGVKSGLRNFTYIDGILAREIRYPYDASSGSTYNMHIGHHGAWGVFFKGQIDDVRIYDRALTPAEVTQLYEIESAPILTTLTPQSGLITGGGRSYPAGSSATLAAQPNSGFVFKQWTGDASGSVNPLQVVMNASKTIGAEFSPDMSDIDSDGLTAYDEVIVFGTDPAVADTDKDGITDGVETGVGVFSVVDGIFTWEQARVDAVAKGGRLATFGSAMEWQGALRAIGSDALVGRIGIWIGATDQVEEGSWRWVTGEELTFQNWADGEPDNANDSDFADVAGTELVAAGKWYDRRSTAERDGYLLEKAHASSPVKADSDDDGLNDNEEKVAGSHPLMADSDSDGLNDVQELRLTQTSPINSDTDGDGLADAQEDPDGDGLTHTQEILESKTNPLVADTDGDGFDDRFELVSGFDPTRGDSTPDAVTTILPAVEFRFNAAVGASYRIEGSNDLESWVIIEPAVIGQGGVVTRLYSIEAHPTRYLRVRRN